jgi:hypothetical protein
VLPVTTTNSATRNATARPAEVAASQRASRHVRLAVDGRWVSRRTSRTIGSARIPHAGSRITSSTARFTGSVWLAGTSWKAGPLVAR